MKINIFGSTGIIGSKTLDIISNYFPSIKINLLCSNTNVKKLIRQIEIFSPKYVYLNDSTKIDLLAPEEIYDALPTGVTLNAEIHQDENGSGGEAR